MVGTDCDDEEATVFPEADGVMELDNNDGHIDDEDPLFYHVLHQEQQMVRSLEELTRGGVDGESTGEVLQMENVQS